MIFGCGQDRGGASQERLPETQNAVTQENFVDLAKYHYSRALSLPSSIEREENLTSYKRRAVPTSHTHTPDTGCSVVTKRRFGQELTHLTLTCPHSGLSLTLHNHTYVTIVRYQEGKEVERKEQSLLEFMDPGADFPMGGEL